MLDTVDLDRTLSRATYERSFAPLRAQLAALQRSVFEAGVPVVVVLEGWDASGKGDTLEKLVSRIDPRGYQVHVTRAPSDDEQKHPWMWRFWQRLPERGAFAFFDRSWYRRVLEERVEGEVPRRTWEAAYEEVNQFERMLVEDGALVVKFFLHVSRAEQRRRLEKMAASPVESWRVTKRDWKAHRKYPLHAAAAEEMLERTSTPWAPWTVVPATDKRYRRIRVFETLVERLEQALEARHARRAQGAAKAAPPAAGTGRGRAAGAAAARAAPAKGAARAVRVKAAANVLDGVDLGRRLEPARYEKAVEKLQARLRELEFAAYSRRVPVIVGFEGWDAAGKGGAIKRLTGGLDPRGYTVLPVAAPKGEEATHHYLWRFWRRLPRNGHLAIFDRTWYGRVLVERVEGFCAEADWRRAYHEINEFERSLHADGAVLVKFWLHVGKETQLARFRERERDPAKRYKITEEDWRNREKWDLYRAAVHDMVTRTSTTYAPWTIVEADDKLWARVRCLRTVVEALEARLG